MGIDITSTNNNTIWDEDALYSVNVTSTQDLQTVSKLWDGTNEVTVTNNRLDVNTIPSSIRFNSPIHETDGYDTGRNKINYIVPTGKVLYLVTLITSLMDGKIFIEWQSDNVAFTHSALDKDGNTNSNISTIKEAPFGPFAAGEKIRARREDGDNGKDWSATMLGYLENA